MTISARLLANFIVALLILFIVNRYLAFWHDWPNVSQSISLLFDSNSEKALPWQAYFLLSSYALIFLVIVGRAFSQKKQTLLTEAERYARWSAFIVRFAFWSVFLIGIVDTFISALRIENVLAGLVGADMNIKLGIAKFRGLYVHYPLLVLSAVIAVFTRSLSVIWLAILVVFAEFSIVITRFIFSYEQAYMGDLVRFWYAALFLFASAYTLYDEGHVRVDVLYATMRRRSKAWVNTLGSLLLGIPICYTILLMGLEKKQSALASPLVSFEISQSGYGLFVKYLMAGFLIIFAVSMAMQFVSYFLQNVAILLGDKNAQHLFEEEHTEVSH